MIRISRKMTVEHSVRPRSLRKAALELGSSSPAAAAVPARCSVGAPEICRMTVGLIAKLIIISAS